MSLTAYDIAMMKQLILKDWQIYQKQLAAYVLGMLLGLTLIGIGYAWTFYIGALLLCLAATPAWSLLPIQHWQTKNGARVYFVEARNLPMLDVSVDFPAGSAYDTRQKSGVAALTQSLLKLGAHMDRIYRRVLGI